MGLLRELRQYGVLGRSHVRSSQKFATCEVGLYAKDAQEGRAKRCRGGEVEMRKVVAAEFLSLDGVMESPDKWHFPYFNEEMGQAVGESFATADAMLMGRVNYEEWAAFWPGQDPQENPMATQMNATKSTSSRGPSRSRLGGRTPRSSARTLQMR